MAQLPVYKGPGAKIKGLRKIKPRKYIKPISSAEEIAKMRSVIEASTRTRNRIERAKIELEYQKGNLDDVGKLDGMLALYRRQLERETDPADRAELESKILSTENRKKGLLLFKKIDDRANEWNKKLSQIDNLKRAGKYGEAYELAQSVYIEQRDAYQEIADQLPDDAYLRNKYDSTVIGKLDKVNDRMTDLAELEQKRLNTEGERQQKEAVKEILRGVGVDVSAMYKAAQIGEMIEFADGSQKRMTFQLYYETLANEVYPGIDQFRQQYLGDPKLLKIIDSAINEETHTLKPDATGGKSFAEMKDDVARKIAAGNHYKMILRQIPGEDTYKFDYVYADTSDPKWKNYGTIFWAGLNILVEQKHISETSSGDKIYGFDIPQFSDSLNDYSGKKEKWIIDVNGKFVPLSTIDTKSLNLSYDTTTRRLNSETVGNSDRIILGSGAPKTPAKKDDRGFFSSIIDKIKNIFKIEQPKFYGIKKREDREITSAFEAPKLPGPQIDTFSRAFSFPTKPTSMAMLPTPLGVPDLRGTPPRIPPSQIPQLRFPQQSNISSLIGIPGSFDLLRGGISASQMGPRRFNSYYDLVDRNTKNFYV